MDLHRRVRHNEKYVVKKIKAPKSKAEAMNRDQVMSP